MFGQVIVWAYNRYVTRLKTKQGKLQTDINKKKEIEFYENMQRLYKFAHFLNQQFANRKERKTFWKRVGRGEEQIDSVIQRILTAYKKNEEAKKAKKNIKEKPVEKTI